MKSLSGIGLMLVSLVLLNRSAAQEKYNVLFIAIDGLNPSVLSAYGNTYSQTPNFQRLAKRAVVFENAFCQQSSCAPSRASLMTGYRPDTLQVNSGNVHFRDRFPEVLTFPQLFKKAGYYTQAIGLVSHAHPAQPDDSSWTVPERLLEIFKRDEYLLPENRTRGFINPMEKGTATESVVAPDNAYQDGQVTQLAIEMLTKLKDQPFLLAVGFKRPHLPYSMPRKYWDLYDPATIPMPSDNKYPSLTTVQAGLRYAWTNNRGEMRAYTDMPGQGPLTDDQVRKVLHGYYASVSYVDAQIGRLLHALDSLHLTEKTIIVIWADHGNHLGERGLWGKNDLTEDANHIPLIIAAPRKKGNGQKTAALVETVDLYPTLVGLCGLQPPAHLQGESLVRLLDYPGAQGKKAVFSRYPRDSEKVIGESIRDDRYRYSQFREMATGKVLDRTLYDVRNDPQQYHNLVDQREYQKIVSRLTGWLNNGWRALAN